jgi:hypothetical protein
LELLYEALALLAEVVSLLHAPFTPAELRERQATLWMTFMDVLEEVWLDVSDRISARG